MKTRYSALVLGLLCIVNLAAANVEHETTVRTALDSITWNFQNSWAFNETTMEEGIVTVGRFDPSSTELSQWQLLSFDNRPPSIEEREAYLESKEFAHVDLLEDDSDGLASLVRFDTLQLVEKTTQYLTYSFEPDFDSDEDAAKFMRKLTGTLRVARDSGRLMFMDIRNTKSIRPIIGAKIKRMVMRFEFGEAVVEGPWVIKKLEVHVQGSALVFVRFNELERYEFSDFEYVGES